MHCLSPPVTKVPEGSWFCKACAGSDSEDPMFEPKIEREGEASIERDEWAHTTDRDEDMGLVSVDSSSEACQVCMLCQTPLYVTDQSTVVLAHLDARSNLH